MSAPTQDVSEAAQLARKRKAVDELEMAWVAAHVGDAKANDGGGGGRLRAIIETIIGNLQLSITNVHVRYEVGGGVVLFHTLACADRPQS